MVKSRFVASPQVVCIFCINNPLAIPTAILFTLAKLTNSVKSAIDNATRGLIRLGQLPVTCGLFFSLGHSTIVIIIVSSIPYKSYERLHPSITLERQLPLPFLLAYIIIYLALEMWEVLLVRLTSIMVYEEKLSSGQVLNALYRFRNFGIISLHNWLSEHYYSMQDIET